MNGRRSIAIVGGDLRNVKLAELFSEDEYKVSIYGFKDIDIEPKLEVPESLSETVGNADIVIGPVPCSLDGQTLNCTYCERKIYVNELF